MIQLSCDCGWRSSEPSRLQADAALDKHRRLYCSKERTCAICTNVAPGASRVLEEGGPAVFVCRACDELPPSSDRYSFSGSVSDGTGFLPPKGRRCGT